MSQCKEHWHFTVPNKRIECNSEQKTIPNGDWIVQTKLYKLVRNKTHSDVKHCEQRQRFYCRRSYEHQLKRNVKWN